MVTSNPPKLKKANSSNEVVEFSLAELEADQDSSEEEEIEQNPSKNDDSKAKKKSKQRTKNKKLEKLKKSRKRRQQNKLEMLPFKLLVKIIHMLENEDLKILSLTCKIMMTSVHDGRWQKNALSSSSELNNDFTFFSNANLLKTGIVLCCQETEKGKIIYSLEDFEDSQSYQTDFGNLIYRKDKFVFLKDTFGVAIIGETIEPIKKKKKKRRKIKHKEFVLDLIFLDIRDISWTNQNTPNTGFSFGKLLTNKNTFYNPYFVIKYGDQEITLFVEITESSPTLNLDCSFQIEANEKHPLSIALFDRPKFGGERFLGECLLPGDIKIGQDVPSPFSLPFVDSCIDSQPTLLRGTANIILQKSLYNSKTALLAHFGQPAEILPLRLQIGDCILIDNKDLYTQLAKYLQWSNWDHILMIVETRGLKRAFESTIYDGVFCTRMETRFQFYLEASKLGIRRLKVERTPEMINSLENFVGEVLGRPYKQNYIEFVKAWNNSTNETEDLSGIFCSELVAAAYQRMGVLSSKLTSNNFLPADFGSDEKLHFIQGKLCETVTVGPKRTIQEESTS